MMNDGTKAEWDEPKQVTAFPRPIPDAELAFLQRVRPDTPLPELRDFLLKWWIQTMKLGTQKYGCVRQLFFLQTSVDKNSRYPEALARRPRGNWWVDVGSAFGQDVRLPVLDGWPASRMLATDLIPDLWEAGLGLYPNPQNIKYITANVLDSSASAERLEAYRGTADVVSSNLVFHTLSKEGVDGMLTAIMDLLIPGGLLLGACAASVKARQWTEYDPERWLHSPQTLEAAFETAGFEQVVVEEFHLPEGHAAYGKIGLRFSGLKPSGHAAQPVPSA